MSSNYNKAATEQGFSATNFVKPQLTWDDDDINRKKALRHITENASTVEQYEIDVSTLALVTFSLITYYFYLRHLLITLV